MIGLDSNVVVRISFKTTRFNQLRRSSCLNTDLPKRSLVLGAS
jgi:hypothetical protein